MAAASSESPARLALCALLFLCVLVADSSAEGRNAGSPCEDGTYEHSGRLCCLCSAGQHLKEHCTANQEYGVCEHCPPQTYSIQPNNQKLCGPCSSCSQPNANLEVAEACTSARDTKCKCRKDHYCRSYSTDKCRICHPCEVCPDGIKEACTANNNTVCEAKVGGGVIAAIIIVLIVLCVIGLASFFLFKRYREKNGNQGTDAEMQPFTAHKAVDLLRYLPDIAKILGWKDMKDVATRSGIQDPVIESCQQEHTNDQEQTLHLLKIWEERQGKEASKILDKSLVDNNKRGQAEKIRELLPKVSA